MNAPLKNEGHKRCADCQTERPLSCFRQQKNAVDKTGRGLVCKECKLKKNTKLAVLDDGAYGKKCVRCSETKPLYCYHVLKTGFLGTRNECIPCFAVLQKATRAKLIAKKAAKDEKMIKGFKDLANGRANAIAAINANPYIHDIDKALAELEINGIGIVRLRKAELGLE